MREIKFRAWDKRNKRMVVVLAIAFDTNYLHYALDNSWGVKYGKSYWSDISNFELMQYTGFKDKNGKEIYEGDILRSPANEFFEVFWSGNGWVLNGTPIDDKILEHFEVTGNIYENPELLGGLK